MAGLTAHLKNLGSELIKYFTPESLDRTQRSSLSGAKFKSRGDAAICDKVLADFGKVLSPLSCKKGNSIDTVVGNAAVLCSRINSLCKADPTDPVVEWQRLEINAFASIQEDRIGARKYESKLTDAQESRLEEAKDGLREAIKQLDSKTWDQCSLPRVLTYLDRALPAHVEELTGTTTILTYAAGRYFHGVGAKLTPEVFEYLARYIDTGERLRRSKIAKDSGDSIHDATKYFYELISMFGEESLRHLWFHPSIRNITKVIDDEARSAFLKDTADVLPTISGYREAFAIKARARFMVRILGAEGLELQNEALKRGSVIGLECFRYGSGDPSDDTVKLAASAATKVATKLHSILHSERMGSWRGETLEEKISLLTNSYSYSKLGDAWLATLVLSNFFEHARGYRSDFHRVFLNGAGAKAYAIWQGILVANENSSERLLKHFPPLRTLLDSKIERGVIRGYFAASPDYASACKPIEALTKLFNPEELAHILRISGGNNKQLSLLAAVMPKQGDWDDDRSERDAILKAESLDTLIDPLVEERVEQCVIQAIKVGGVPESARGDLTKSFRLAIRQSYELGDGLNPSAFFRATSKSKFTTVLMGAQRPGIEPTSGEVVSVVGVGDLLKEVFPFGLLAGNEFELPSNNRQIENRPVDRAAIRSQILKATASKIDGIAAIADDEKLLERFRSDGALRRRLFLLLGDVSFQSTVLRPILERAGIKPIEVNAFVLSKSDFRSWAGPNIMGGEYEAIQFGSKGYMSNMMDPNFAHLAFERDGALVGLAGLRKGGNGKVKVEYFIPRGELEFYWEQTHDAAKHYANSRLVS